MKSVNDFYDALERASNNKTNDISGAINDYGFTHGRLYGEWEEIELQMSDTAYLTEELNGFPDELLELISNYEVNLSELYISPEIEDYLNKELEID